VVALIILGSVALLIWLGILLHPARPWDFRPVGEDDSSPLEPAVWPAVCALVPARNESETLPQTLPALLTQDYPGELTVIVIDDRSQDGTAATAHNVAAQAGAADRLQVLAGADLPEGWVGKVWALEQGTAWCSLASSNNSRLPQSYHSPSAFRPPPYLLLTDADIHHAPRSLRRLVAESEAGRFALNSRMARLRCVSGPERLLIPPFVFFFNLLYPMRWINDRTNPVAAAAGGCVLLAAPTLECIGGFACISDKIIDDVNLARQVKNLGESIQLALSRSEVQSLRRYESLTAIWTMVRRTAFTELQYSWIRLVGAVLGLVLMFLVPPLFFVGGIGLVLGSVAGWSMTPPVWALVLAGQGLCTWGLMAVVYRPAVLFFGLSRLWSVTLPLAGLLYGAMTVDSALRYLVGKRTTWRD
jgi:hopene-associated glycosyltransferase HpnB